MFVWVRVPLSVLNRHIEVLVDSTLYVYFCYNIMKEEIRKNIIEYWKTRSPFKSLDDIGDIPTLSEDDYKKYIIPNIIRCGGIPKKDLIVGETYIGSCRNSEEAVWNGAEFVYKRYKFGFTYDDSVNHFEDDNGYDLFVPISKK